MLLCSSTVNTPKCHGHILKTSPALTVIYDWVKVGPLAAPLKDLPEVILQCGVFF